MTIATDPVVSAAVGSAVSAVTKTIVIVLLILVPTSVVAISYFWDPPLAQTANKGLRPPSVNVIDDVVPMTFVAPQREQPPARIEVPPASSASSSVRSKDTPNSSPPIDPKELRAGIVASNLPTKSDFVSTLDTLIPVITAAASVLTTGEQQVNTLFQNEINARKTVVDCLWAQRKIVETILGRAGKTLARYVFFDFRKTNDDDAASPTPPHPATAPGTQGG